MTEARFSPPPVPEHLVGFPVVGGLVVPYITLRHRDGRAALGLVRGDLVDQCLRERRCGVCGIPQPPEERMVFFLRESDLHRNCTVEPGMCPPCAAYTQRACPMVSGFMSWYRKNVSPLATRRCGDELCSCRAWAVPDGASARLGDRAERWHALWTRQYRLTRDPEGRLAAGFDGVRVLAVRRVPSAAADRAITDLRDLLRVVLELEGPEAEA